MDSSDGTPGTRRFTIPAVIGFLLVLPFIILELLNADNVIAVFWSGLVLDQMPCFLGVPNCD